MQRSAFFDSMNGDRPYGSADFARLFAALTGRDGVVAGDGDELKVSATTPPTMDVRVGLGSAWIQGRYYQLYGAPELLQISQAHASLTRIDRVVVRMDTAQAARKIEVYVKQGIPAASPQPPSLTRDTEAWEISLAQVRVNPGASQITDADITDERGDVMLCGFVMRPPSMVLDVTQFGARGNGVADDTEAIKKALALRGRIYLPPGDYIVSDTLDVFGDTTIEGAADGRTIVYFRGSNKSLFRFGNGARKVAIKSLTLNCPVNNNATAFEFNPTDWTQPPYEIDISNIHIDGFSKGVEGRNFYFAHFQNIRMQSTVRGFDLHEGSNSIILTNCSLFTEEHGLLWHNSYSLSIRGCTFELNAPVHLYAGYAVDIAGCYFEKAGASPEDYVEAWITLGTGSGADIHGVSITGSVFEVGARYSLKLMSVIGLDVRGNYFRPLEGVYYIYSWDSSAKRNLSFGANSYNIDGMGPDFSKIFVFPIGAVDTPNTHANSDVPAPLLFFKQHVPQNSHLEPNQAALYWDGTNLKLRKKDAAGVVTETTLA